MSIPSKNELVRFYLSVAVLRMHIGESRDDLNKVRKLGEWEAAAFERFGQWPWGEQMLGLQVVSVTVDKLREWQCELMKNNETIEVLHIHDGWELKAMVGEVTETVQA